MKEYVKNMKKYVKNMKEYVENMKEYGEIMSIYWISHRPYKLWDFEKIRPSP